MIQLLSQNSYIFVGLAVLVIAYFVSLRLQAPRRRVLVAAVVVLLIAFALLMRTSPGSVSTEAELERVLARGKPVAVEFYSNF